MLNKIILGTAQLGMKYGINNYGILSKNESFNMVFGQSEKNPESEFEVQFQKGSKS